MTERGAGLVMQESCDRWLRAALVDVPSARIELDEIWGFVGCKQKTADKRGYTDERGTFHFVLADIGAGQLQQVTEKLSKRTLSTDELSAWLRDVDAGEMVMVVYACPICGTSLA